ncbi:hypothetical protein B7494_g3735 [Chlorociboria aeruginascens]|nr:hypothetical protein B7494_g3735 [Chlorociboria aeruginascens]
MSTGQLSRTHSRASRSSKGTAGLMAEISMPPREVTRYFEPCAATASMFLYAQGNTVVCAHHDTLTIERRFSRHTEEVRLLAVDTVSERGAGRMVVSYDAGQTAIVWDCLTGDEIARFASYEDLTVAAWMRNGNVAFGNSQGNIILFEPTTSEHISARTIDQIPITALAPAADCRTYAIGFSNGSLLIAALQPRFTILYNLTTSRGPSPIATLAWHASSSRQKSDMLATQTDDGDLRVWSIAKSHSSNDPAKVVRVLKRSENFQTGPNWLGWSKNGRIIQFSEGETSSWDVRTKHVTYEPVPTLNHVRGIALYGPGASLFTLGSNNTAQQFDLNSPPVLVANVQHPANLLPPSPPISIEERMQQDASNPAGSAEWPARPINVDISESYEDHMSPLARIAREMDKLELERQEPDRADTLSPLSVRSHNTTSTSSTASNGSRHRRERRRYARYTSSISHGSVISRALTDGTMMSLGGTIPTAEPSSISSRDSLSTGSLSSSHSSSHHRSRGKSSRLRQEVLPSPNNGQVTDLFEFTKARLSDIPYRHPQVLDSTHLTNNDLRRQMLSTIFGFEGEASDLIRDEMAKHPLGSSSRVLLVKWLGDVDPDILAANFESMTASDWMLLALSGIGGQASQAKAARAYVQRLLEKGDVHTAATIMIGMGDQNDAIEIYVSHKRYMEALILTCHVFPADWQRQAELVRKWGEWAVQHGQQQLAIRCFSCVGSESSEPWSSPSAQQATFPQGHSQSIPEILSPPLSPPSARGPQRSIAKTSALKLITSFGEEAQNSKFFGFGDSDRTPLAGGATPIAESALSPSGGDTAHTAFLRPRNRSLYNTPASARTATPGGFGGRRLPAAGETPTNVTPRVRRGLATLPTPVDSGSDKEKNGRLAPVHERSVSQPEQMQLNSARYTPIEGTAATSPMVERERAGNTALPSPSTEFISAMKRGNRTRSGSRQRKPIDLQLQWPPMESIITGNYTTSPELSTASSKQSFTSRSVTGSVASSARSPAVSERSHRNLGNASPVVTGRSIDRYISSLESAQYHAQKQRSREAASKGSKLDGKSKRARSGSRSAKPREPSEDGGRSGLRYITPAQRSPSSPVPMSPEDLRVLGANQYDEEPSVTSPVESRRGRSGSAARYRSIKATSRVRHSSPDSAAPRAHISTKLSSRNASRRRSPDAHPLTLDTRGRERSKGRSGSAIRSPSSPLPMSPQVKRYRADDEDDIEDLQRTLEDQKRFRSRQRSTSRLRERGSSVARDNSPDRSRRDRSKSRKPSGRESSRSRKGSTTETGTQPDRPNHSRSISEQNQGDLSQINKEERTLKKEQAARELEERRKSLARRPSAPTIMHPEELASLSPLTYRPFSVLDGPQKGSTFPSPMHSPISSPAPPPLQTSQAYPNQSSSSSPQIGLPATPRAMRHPKFDPDANRVPDVPQIPEKYDLQPSPSPSPLQPAITWGSSNGTSNENTSDTLGPLPKTTYQAAPRRVPPRSASAPIPEESFPSPKALPATLPTHPAFQAALPPSNRRRTQDAHSMRPSLAISPRKINSGESQPGTLGYETRHSPISSSGPVAVMSGIVETIEPIHQGSPNEDLIPPPPPPSAPPILKELQHLAMPPPPPPAPLYRPSDLSINPIVSGVSSASGVIEIVMDEDDEKVPNAPTHSKAAVVEPQPSPPQHPRRPSHSRGRSETDNSLSGRFSRAAERLRSASRGRNNGAKSPTSAIEVSPYESVPPLWAMTRSSNAIPALGTAMGNTERHPREVKAAMDAMGGNMI